MHNMQYVIRITGPNYEQMQQLEQYAVKIIGPNYVQMQTI